MVSMALVSCSNSTQGTKSSRILRAKDVYDAYTAQLDELNELRLRVKSLEAGNEAMTKTLTQSRIEYEKNMNTMKEYFKDELERYKDQDSMARTLGWMEVTQFEMLASIQGALPNECQTKMLDAYEDYWQKNPVPSDIDWSIDF